MMVALKFFVDEDKSIDWIKGIEGGLRKCGSVRGFEMGFVLLVVIIITQGLPDDMQGSFLFSAIMGLLVFLLVDGLGEFLD